MNKKEFALFASALRTYYPREKLLPNEQAMELWFNQLQDIPYKLAELTLNTWVATNKWSPSIADIRENATGLTQGEPKDWGEAWREVLRAINIYGSYPELEALESMDETTKRVVERLGFRNICLSEDIQVDRANFRMIYEQEIQRAKEDAQIPPRLKELMASMPLLLGEGGE